MMRHSMLRIRKWYVKNNQHNSGAAMDSTPFNFPTRDQSQKENDYFHPGVQQYAKYLIWVLAREEGHGSVIETFGKKSCFWTTSLRLVSVDMDMLLKGFVL